MLPKKSEKLTLNALTRSATASVEATAILKNLREGPTNHPRLQLKSFMGSRLCVSSAHVSGFPNLQGTSVWLQFLPHLHQGIFPLSPLGFPGKGASPPLPVAVKAGR